MTRTAPILSADRRKRLVSEALNLTIVLYALLLPFSYAFTVFTGPLILLALWLLEGGLAAKFKKIRSNRAIALFLLFVALHLLSLLWSGEYHEASRILKFYFAIAIDLVVLSTSLKRGYATAALFAFLLSMFVSEVLLYGVFLEWWSFKKASPQNPSPIMHHIFYSIFLAVTILLLLWQLFDPKVNKTLKLFELFFLTSATFNLFLNGGRTGQLAFAIAVFVFVLTYFGFRKKYLVRTFTAIAVLFTVAYFASPVFHARVHEGIRDVKGIVQGNLNSSWGLRIAMKKVGWEMAKEHPLLGAGVGDVMAQFHRQYEKSGLKDLPFLKTNTHVHDQYLQILLQTGAAGLAVFLLFLYYLFRTPFEDPLTRAVFYGILTIFVFAFFVDVPLRKFTAGLFGFVIGYMLHRADIQTQANHQGVNG